MPPLAGAGGEADWEWSKTMQHQTSDHPPALRATSRQREDQSSLTLPCTLGKTRAPTHAGEVAYVHRAVLSVNEGTIERYLKCASRSEERGDVGKHSRGVVA